MTGDDWRWNPDLLWQQTRLGREEYVQRLLAALVLGTPTTVWNARARPTRRGAEFIRRLHARSFDGTPSTEPVFIDEFELPSRHESERAGWPDHGVDWPGRLFLIELKTERRSHRKGQLEHYLDLARHHHPDRSVDLLYVTPAMQVSAPAMLPDGGRYAHMSWTEIAPLIAGIWLDSDVEWEPVVARQLMRWIEALENAEPLPSREAPGPAATSEAIDAGRRIAAETQADGKQRAIEAPGLGAEALEEARIQLRDELLQAPAFDGVRITHVRPWIWRAETSGGTALTKSGDATGYELRLSRYQSEESESKPRASAE